MDCHVANAPRNDGALGARRSLDSGSKAGCPRGMTEQGTLRGMTEQGTLRGMTQKRERDDGEKREG
ncbi:MAG: hypothetical protein NC218_08805 [Acetobacter sp.]|nr:hypothetical protein [Acetobacter sp.]